MVFHLPSDDPYLNLSIEHFLFQHAEPTSHILIFYSNRPCVVIGRNQNPWLETDLKRIQQGLPAEEKSHEALENPARESLGPTSTVDTGVSPEDVPIDLVRRRSGGGTVFHDFGNLNYSVITPHTKEWTRNEHAEMVVQALRSLTAKTDQDPKISLPDVRVNDRNDIVMQWPNQAEWLKVSGSAFKLTKWRALHHGTLLFSSPYLQKISELLRSPGRDFITAQGVESVRTKVGNLAWTASLHERNRIKHEITRAIVQQFWDMYTYDYLHEDNVTEVIVSSPNSLEEIERQNPIIAAGMKELMSPAWTFGQTPKFDFKSGMLNDHEVNFHAVKGTLKQIELKSLVPFPQSSPDEALWTQRRKSVGKAGNQAGMKDEDEVVKLHEVEDWKSLVSELPQVDASLERQTWDYADQREANPAIVPKADVPDALIQRLEAIFPHFPLWQDGCEH